eukprot:jgi/Botrbrau1/7681/Bobra.0159s0123.1
MSVRPGSDNVTIEAGPSKLPDESTNPSRFASVWDRSRRGSTENASRRTSEQTEAGPEPKRTESGSLESSIVSASEAGRRTADAEVHHESWIAFSSEFSGWTPDRGDGRYSEIRHRVAMPALITTGKNGGESRIQLTNAWAISWFAFTRDFFISVLNVPMHYLLPALSVIYVIIFFFFSGVWAAIHKANNDCLYGITDYTSIWIFAMVTTQTIGYGNSGPNNCAWAAAVIYIQLMMALILNAMVVGIVFARVAFPQHRGRTIAISNSACILRRDGVLKFTFRLMDMRMSQVVSPHDKGISVHMGGRAGDSRGGVFPRPRGGVEHWLH